MSHGKASRSDSTGQQLGHQGSGGHGDEVVASRPFSLPPGYYDYYGIPRPKPAEGTIQAKRHGPHQSASAARGVLEYYGLLPQGASDEVLGQGPPRGAASAGPGVIQAKSDGSVSQGEAAVHEAAAHGTRGSSGSLPYLDQIQTSFGRHDVSQVQAHTGQAATEAAQAMGAEAYATGDHVAFAGTPSLHTAAHEAVHVIQQRAGVHLKGGMGEVGDPYERHADAVADRVVAGRSTETLLDEFVGGAAPSSDAVPASASLQRKEVRTDAEVKSKSDWTTKDREGETARWKAACLTNLKAVDSAEYVKIVERRDFYKWFYEYSAARGFQTRWALAAWAVANGAHQIADMDGVTDDVFGLTNVQFQGIMREGNQVIFDNVLPKLKALVIDGEPITNKQAALAWDMKILSEEQNLIQPLYDKMAPDTKKKLEYIARKQGLAGTGAWLKRQFDGGDWVAQGDYNKEGVVPAFDGKDLTDPKDRWRYGMGLGKKFAPEDTGYDAGKHPMPDPGKGYKDGSELKKVDTRPNVHQLDAWLSPERLTRVQGTPGADIQGIISQLTPFEKSQILLDKSPDGWAYSKQFAQWSFITEAMVRQALPGEPAHAAAVSAFLGRYRAERKAVELKYPNTRPFSFGP